MSKWPTVKLENVCSFLNGGTPSKAVPEYFTGEIPWITGADIVGNVACIARSFITEKAIKESATNLISKGTVLLVTRTSVGKVAIAGRDLCFSQDITALIPDAKKLDPNYLVDFLKSQEAHFKQHQRGATIQGISRDVVGSVEIPLPPLDEQRRIAAILDKADVLRQKRRQAIGKLDDLVQATFLEMFGDPVTNPMGWPVKKLSESLAFLTSGSRGWARYYSDEGSPFLRIQNVGRGQLLLDDLAFVNQELKTVTEPGVFEIIIADQKIRILYK